MGRDTTAGLRMAAMRSREKAAGLRRLNVAVKPEVFDKLAELMKQHDCPSQARLIELLILTPSVAAPAPAGRGSCNVVTEVMDKTKRYIAAKKQTERQKKKAPAKIKAAKKAKIVNIPQKEISTQLSLF
jgi:hypothetical protein